MTAAGSFATVGLDASTTSAKAIVRRLDGKILASASVAYSSQYLPGGRVEQDAEDWWKSASAAIREAVAKSHAGNRVLAICATTQGITVVPTDRAYQPLRAAITWLDLRAESQAAELERAFDVARFFQRTGRRPHASFTLPKVVWVREHEPEIFENAFAWLTPLPFLIARVTGSPVTDHTQAAGTLSYELASGDWSDEVLEWARIDRRTLPPIAWSGTDLGPMPPRVSEELGLPNGVRVVLGAQDQKCAAYGAGLETGVVTVSLGTAAAISGLINDVPNDPECRVPVSPFLHPGVWVLEAVVPAAATSLEWLARTLGTASGKPVSVSRLIRLAQLAPAGSNGVRFAPHLAGSGTPHWDAAATGSFSGLTLGSTANDLARSILEGVAMEVARNIEVLKDLGVQIDELCLMGGGARSPLWCQIIENSVAMPTRTSVHAETAAIGAAMLAAKAASA